MVTASDFRNGITFELDGNVCQVLEFQHVKPGKGAAFVRTKLKNVITGGIIEKTFRPTEKFEMRILTVRIWNTPIKMEICTTLWIWKRMS